MKLFCLTGRKFLATLAFLFLVIISCTNQQLPETPGDKKLSAISWQQPLNDTGLVTVGAWRPLADGRYMEVIFNERAKVYRIAREDKDFANYNRYFEASFRNKTPVKIIIDIRQGILLKVMEPSAEELKLFLEFRKEMFIGDSSRRINITRIDTSTFNIVDQYLKWPAFNLCQKVVPDYAKAKEIFDYCATQSCHLPGPTQVTPCIPFQFVQDGCYARAHKMRWIIEQYFGYCSEKVFSFATIDNHRLNVKANKWGGCCVEWWYHVTPLIRVKSTRGLKPVTLAYVIDPGMFDKPVLLSTWLAAQKTTSCNPNSMVDTYSIQSSTAYTPSYPNGTPYATDPNYTQTNSMLINYASATTCN